MDNFLLRSSDPNAAMAMMRNPMATNVDRRTLGGRLSGTWRWGDFQLVGGLDGQTSEHRRRQSSYAMMSGAYTDADSFPWETDADFRNYGIFAELTWYATQASRLIGGARLDRAYAEDERDTLKNNMGVGWRNPTAGKERSETLTGGFLRYERDLDAVPATAYLGHSERFPDYWELFSATSLMNVPTAFETIDPEKTTQLDFGIQYQAGPLEAWASAYVGRVHDFILFDYATMPSGHVRTTADNVDARIMGAELGAGYRFGPSWKGDASLAWAWGKNSSDDRPLPQIPPLEARLSLTWERGDWSAGGLWRLVAAQNRVAENQGSIVAKDFDESVGFGVFSVNGAWRLNRHYRLSTGIDNLFDKTYGEHLNLAGNGAFDLPADSRIDEPGRTWWARLDMSF